jgi:hypothetical protein
MDIALLKWASRKVALSGAALLALTGLSARGQYLPPAAYSSPAAAPVYMMGNPYAAAYGPTSGWYPSATGFGGPQAYGSTYPAQGMMYPPMMQPHGGMSQLPYQPYVCPPHPCLPGMAPPAPTTEPGRPTEPTRPGQKEPSAEPGSSTQPPEPTGTDLTPPELPSERGAPGDTGEAALSLNGADAGGYIDTALPLTQYRLRVDTANDNNRPDRADYFYPKCGCFRANGSDPNAPGPGRFPADHVNYEIVSNYLEFAPHPRFSGWVDIPVRWVDIFFRDPTAPPEFHAGLSDILFGFKAAIIYRPTQLLTFQLRTYSPTGDASLGLGRNNWNLEPGLLFYQRLTPRLFFEGQIQDFIPIASADDFAGNVLSYGGALSYLAYNRPYFRVLPVAEMLSWTVLSGKDLSDSGPVNAAGQTIVNAKFGVRFGFGQMTQPNYFINRADLYLGYGRALTGDVWYKNTARAEFRLRF